MAQLQIAKDIEPTKINKFLGLNQNRTGDTQLKLGESGNMSNFYITDDFKLRKTFGYKSKITFDTPIKGVFGTKIANTEYLLVATGGKLYYFYQTDLIDDTITPTAHELGSIGNADCTFFEFDNKVYIISGGYYKWDGTTFSEVIGYTPLVFINSIPAGSGTIYEEINMISPNKHQTFNGDGTSKDFFIAQKGVSSIYRVDVNGTTLTPTTDYTVDLTAGKVTFTTAPSQNMDNVDIYWSKDDGDRNIIANMKCATIFGGDVDTRVFVYGNTSCQNRVYFSGNTEDGPSVEYFPATSQLDVGPSNFAVTDLTRQYDRLLATTNKSEAYYLTLSSEELDVVLTDNSKVSRLVPSVSIYPLNQTHGNLALGQGQLINNFPITVDRTGLMLWKATNVRDEKNVQNISIRIQADLNELPVHTAKTIELQEENEVWFAIGNKIYVYNYGIDVFSKLEIAHDVERFAMVGTTLYMATTDGKIMKWDSNYTKFDTEIINAHWEMNFEDFEEFYTRKTMRKVWVQMQPALKAKALIGYITNRMTSPTKKEIAYNVNDGFGNVNFADYSFSLSVNPQPFRLKMKAKKFTNLKITIDNNDEIPCVITGLALKVESFGESK